MADNTGKSQRSYADIANDWITKILRRSVLNENTIHVTDSDVNASRQSHQNHWKNLTHGQFNLDEAKAFVADYAHTTKLQAGQLAKGLEGQSPLELGKKIVETVKEGHTADRIGTIAGVGIAAKGLLGFKKDANGHRHIFKGLVEVTAGAAFIGIARGAGFKALLDSLPKANEQGAGAAHSI